MLSKTLALTAPLLLLAFFSDVRPVRSGDVDAAGDTLLVDEASQRAGVFTLYRHDPVSSSLSFATGGAGHIIQDREAKNWDSHLDFDRYHEGAFTVGIQGGDDGVLVDLGSSEDLRERYGYGETVGGGQGFASIHVDRGAVMIRGADEGPRFQPMRESSLLFSDQGEASDHAPVHLGHTYLARISYREDEEVDLVVKFKVIAHTPGQTATIRWERLQG